MTTDAALLKIRELVCRTLLMSLTIPLLALTGQAQSGIAPTQRLTAADLDGDGKSDLVWTNPATGEVAIRPMEESGASGKSLTLSSVDPAFEVSGAGDLDGDGKADLIWRDTRSGDVMVWLMDADTVRSRSILSTGQSLEWQISGVGDFDGDGKADLIWRNTLSGDVTVWLMDVNTVKARNTLFADLTLEWQIQGVGDLDGDGKVDLIWRNTGSGDVAEWLMNGDVVKSWSVLSSGLALEWQIHGIGDLDRDGEADLVWRNVRTGDVAEWLINGGRVKAWSVVATNFDLSWRISSVSDLDGDGRADLVWRNTRTGEVSEWFMGGDFVKSWSMVDPIPVWARLQYEPSPGNHLQVELFSVTSYQWMNLFVYVPSIRLKETSGKSNVVVTSLVLHIDKMGAVEDMHVYPFSKRIEAGTSQEMNRLNVDGYGSAEIEITSYSYTPNISFTIVYIDDAGRSGTLTAAASISASPNLISPPSENRVNHLQVEQFSMTRYKSGSEFHYVPSIRLKETSGTSSVVVSSLTFRLDDIGVYGNVPPWKVSKRIDAGASRDINDLNFQGYGDPEFEITSSRISSSVSVTIVFTDEAGRSGTVTVAAGVSDASKIPDFVSQNP